MVGDRSGSGGPAKRASAGRAARGAGAGKGAARPAPQEAAEPVAAPPVAPAYGAVESRVRSALSGLDGIEGSLAESTFALAHAVDNAEPSALAPLARELRLALAVFGRTPAPGAQPVPADGEVNPDGRVGGLGFDLGPS